MSWRRAEKKKSEQKEIRYLYARVWEVYQLTSQKMAILPFDILRINPKTYSWYSATMPDGSVKSFASYSQAIWAWGSGIQPIFTQWWPISVQNAPSIAQQNPDRHMSASDITPWSAGDEVVSEAQKRLNETVDAIKNKMKNDDNTRWREVWWGETVATDKVIKPIEWWEEMNKLRRLWADLSAPAKFVSAAEYIQNNINPTNQSAAASSKVRPQQTSLTPTPQKIITASEKNIDRNIPWAISNKSEQQKRLVPTAIRQ